MIRYFLQRLIHSMIILGMLILCVFTILQLSPGDYVSSISGYGTTPADALVMRTSYHLNIPAELKAYTWFSNFLKGDWGVINSLGGVAVLPALIKASKYTLTIVFISSIIGMLFAVFYAATAVKYRNKWQDYVISFFVYAGNAIPDFWIVLMILLGVMNVMQFLPWAYDLIGTKGAFMGMRPGSQFSTLKALELMILPVFVLSMRMTSMFTRYLKNSLIEVSHMEFIRAARSKGLSESHIFWHHTLPNSSLPMLTLFGMILPEVFSSCTIIESLFFVPGLGQLMFIAAFSRDGHLLAGIVIFVAMLSIFMSLWIDVLYAKVDPRIKYN